MIESTKTQGVDERNYQLLIDAVTDYAIYMLGVDGTVLSWNSGAARLKGYKPEEIIGRSFSKFYTDEDRAAQLPQKALPGAGHEAARVHRRVGRSDRVAADRACAAAQPDRACRLPHRRLAGSTSNFIRIPICKCTAHAWQSSLRKHRTLRVPRRFSGTFAPGHPHGADRVVRTADEMIE